MCRSTFGPPLVSALLVAILVAGLSACVPARYEAVEPGTFHGTIDLRWVDSDIFVYIPNPDDPFRFERPDGSVVQPGVLITDGGSTPRALRAFPHLSPWAYAPAYILHDYVFRAHHCQFPLEQPFTFEDSVQIMGEALRTHMETNPDLRHPGVYELIVTSAQSAAARVYWHTGTCDTGAHYPSISVLAHVDSPVPPHP